MNTNRIGNIPHPDSLRSMGKSQIWVDLPLKARFKLLAKRLDLSQRDLMALMVNKTEGQYGH